MAVAVNQRNISRKHLTAPDYLIDGTGAIENIVGLIGAENLCRMFFGIAGSPLMIKK